MQSSQLAAALLGQNTPSNAAEDDEKEDHDPEEADDEDAESAKSAGGKSGGPSNSGTSRTVTLQMLLAADILQPGNGTMSIEYLGQRFIGDLLPDGKIKSQETDIVFASPSAWAIHCKRIINPDKKSGCGWASVKYKGKKLDAYKNIWYKKKKQEEMQDKTEEHLDRMEIDQLNRKPITFPHLPIQRVVVKHNTIANRTFTHDANTLIECVPFSNLGKIQPFLVSISTNAVLVMDFHCHLTLTEVSGYLAGQWDVNGHTLTVTHAFPCRCVKSDRDKAPQIELDIQKQIDQNNLILVGWYHSHPVAPAAPTLRDIDSQLDYQIRMKGPSDSGYTPCIGVICSPYNPEYTTLESAIICYWVIPPPETKPNEYGRPMLMSYSVVQDNVITSSAMDEMRKCADYYRHTNDLINFADTYQSNAATYLDKLKTTLSSKFPRDQNDTVLWRFIKEIIGYAGDDKIDTATTAAASAAATSALLQVPNLSLKSATSSVPSSSAAAAAIPIPASSSSVTMSLSQPLPLPPQVSLANSLSTSSLTSNLMLANVLFSSGKFPSPSSLLGLPDPMAQSTLAANNMFLSPSLFKMQDTLNLLKPLSASSPLASTSKSSSGSDSTAKNKKSSVADSLKSSPLDFASDLNLLSLKTKLDFGIPELNLPKPPSSSSANFNHQIADLSISSVRQPKIDFSASDLCISASPSSSSSGGKSKITSSLTDTFGLDATIKSFMAQEPPSKIPKTSATITTANDYASMLDLSFSASKTAPSLSSFSDSLSSYSGNNNTNNNSITTTASAAAAATTPTTSSNMLHDTIPITSTPNKNDAANDQPLNLTEQ